MNTRSHRILSGLTAAVLMISAAGCGMMQISPKPYHHSGNNPGFKSVNEFLDPDTGNVYIRKH